MGSWDQCHHGSSAWLQRVNGLQIPTQDQMRPTSAAVAALWGGWQPVDTRLQQSFERLLFLQVCEEQNPKLYSWTVTGPNPGQQ